MLETGAKTDTNTYKTATASTTINPAAVFPLDAILPTSSRAFMANPDKELIGELNQNRPVPVSTFDTIRQVALTLIELPGILAYELGKKLGTKEVASEKSTEDQGFVNSVVNSSFGRVATWCAVSGFNLLAAASLANFVPFVTPTIAVTLGTIYFLGTSVMGFERGRKSNCTETATKE